MSSSSQEASVALLPARLNNQDRSSARSIQSRSMATDGEGRQSREVEYVYYGSRDKENDYDDDDDDDEDFEYDDGENGDDDEETLIARRQYVLTRASASEICANPSYCNRELMYLFYEKIQRKVELQLSAISEIFMRSMNAKKYPHTAFYKRTIPREGNAGSGDSASNESKSTRTRSGGAVQRDRRDRRSDATSASTSIGDEKCDFDDAIKDMRNTINERVIDVLNGVSLSDEKRTIATLVDILNQCVRYELAIVNLVTLYRLIVKALENFSDSHRRYDEKIKILQDTSADSKSSTVKANDLRRLQSELDTTRDVLQKLLNQVPLQMGQLKTELELIELYDGADDTPKIHRFLTDPLIMEIVKRSCRLSKVYSLLRHSWDKLIPSDFF